MTPVFVLLFAFATLHTTSALHEETLVVEECVHEPDGYPMYGLCVKREADTIPLKENVDGIPGNDVLKTGTQYLPGPVIRVKHGDKVRITVINRALDAAVSVHWHGIHQKGLSGQMEHLV